MEFKTLINAGWDYLVQELPNGVIVLRVLIDGAGVSEFNIVLDPDEITAMKNDPESVKNLAWDVRNNRKKYEARRISGPLWQLNI